MVTCSQILVNRNPESIANADSSLCYISVRSPSGVYPYENYGVQKFIVGLGTDDMESVDDATDLYTIFTLSAKNNPWDVTEGVLGQADLGGNLNITDGFYLSLSNLKNNTSYSGKVYYATNPSYNTNFYFPAVGGNRDIQTTAQSSSIRVKKNITNISEDEVNKLNNLRVIKFDYNTSETDEQKECGLIAEETINVLPNIVEETGCDDSPYGINYLQLVPYLIKQNQMQQKQIDELKKEVYRLSTQNK